MIFLRNKGGVFWCVEKDYDGEFWEDRQDTVVIGLPDKDAKELAEEILKLCGEGEE